jgi:hypothetical protein
VRYKGNQSPSTEIVTKMDWQIDETGADWGKLLNFGANENT